MLLQPGLSGHPEPVMHTLRKRPPQSETRLLTREPPPFQLNFGQPSASSDLLYSFGFYDPAGGRSPNGSWGLARSGSLEKLPTLPDVPFPSVPNPWMGPVLKPPVTKPNPGNAYNVGVQQKQTQRHAHMRRKPPPSAVPPSHATENRLGSGGGDAGHSADDPEAAEAAEALALEMAEREKAEKAAKRLRARAFARRMKEAAEAAKRAEAERQAGGGAAGGEGCSRGSRQESGIKGRA